MAATGDPDQPRNDGVFDGPFPVDAQRAAVLELLDAVGYDPDHWRLDPSLHPFAQSLAPTDVRLTTKYDEHDFARRAVLRPARVRPRALRGLRRSRR